MVFFLAMFGMVCWGIAPVFGKLGLSQVNPLTGLLIRTYMAAGLLTVWVVINGFGSTISQIRTISWQTWALIGIEGILATLVGDLAYYAALKHGEVSFVTLVMACSPLISMIMAVIVLGEHITLLRMAGSLCIIMGLGLIMK
ncbi:MAG: EamA family transporter [Bacillota bacterium]|nr:EamA family transporter [Bacillota bacterium]